MKLALFNGSPRYKKSNSKILLEHFLTGYNRINPEQVSEHYLAKYKEEETHRVAFQQANAVVIIFPLYTDSMPGIVKRFFESLVTSEIQPGKKIGFIVQSGFPEAIHSIYVERYLKKLTQRLKGEYLGTVIKGGVEGIQIMPPWMTKKLFKKFEELGTYFASHQSFSPELQEELRKPFKLSPLRRTVFTLLSKTGITNFYWNSNLKKNGAYQNRFDQPYLIQ